METPLNCCQQTCFLPDPPSGWGYHFSWNPPPYISLGTSSHWLPPPSPLISTSSLHTSHQPLRCYPLKKLKTFPWSHPKTVLTLLLPLSLILWTEPNCLAAPCPHLLFPHTPQHTAFRIPSHHSWFCYFVKCIDTYYVPNNIPSSGRRGEIRHELLDSEGQTDSLKLITKFSPEIYFIYLVLCF